MEIRSATQDMEREDCARAFVNWLSCFLSKEDLGEMVVSLERRGSTVYLVFARGTKVEDGRQIADWMNGFKFGYLARDLQPKGFHAQERYDVG